MITPAAAPGQNFASYVFRARTTYTCRGAEKRASFILKVELFVEGLKKDILGDLFLFDNEISMYTKLVPEMHRLLKTADDDEVIAPE